MKKGTRILLRWLALLACLAALSWCWLAGLLIILFTALRQNALAPAWTASVLGLAIVCVRLVWRNRWLLRAGWALVFLGALAAASVEARHWWTVGRFAALEHRWNEDEYRPFGEGNKLVKAVCPEELRFSGEIPKIACAYALYPVGAAAVEALYDPAAPKKEVGRIRPTGSPDAYDSLLRGDVSVILALAPSGQQRADAAARKAALELTPVAKDAFVFFVPASSPVEGLTSAQIRDIYSGKTTRWRELGVALDAKLLPYQRNEGSGSQTALQRVMGGTPIMPPIEEDRLGGMGGIVSTVADYRNHPGALGFSFRYYVQDLVKERGVKLLKIDGVAPTVENVRNGSYPFIETSYAVTVKPREGNVKKFVDFLVSPAGREMIEKTGYAVP